MTLTSVELAGQYHDAWSGLDPDRIVALHTDDSVFDTHGLAQPAVGREAVRHLIRDLLDVVPDLHFEAKRGYIAADHIVLEYDMSGTVDDTPFVCDGVDVFAVADGLVARKDSYLDLLSLQRQVGALPDLLSHD